MLCYLYICFCHLHLHILCCVYFVIDLCRWCNIRLGRKDCIYFINTTFFARYLCSYHFTVTKHTMCLLFSEYCRILQYIANMLDLFHSKYSSGWLDAQSWNKPPWRYSYTHSTHSYPFQNNEHVSWFEVCMFCCWQHACGFLRFQK